MRSDFRKVWPLRNFSNVLETKSSTIRPGFIPHADSRKVLFFWIRGHHVSNGR